MSLLLDALKKSALEKDGLKNKKNQDEDPLHEDKTVPPVADQHKQAVSPYDASETDEALTNLKLDENFGEDEFLGVTPKTVQPDADDLPESIPLDLSDSEPHSDINHSTQYQGVDKTHDPLDMETDQSETYLEEATKWQEQDVASPKPDAMMSPMESVESQAIIDNQSQITDKQSDSNDAASESLISNSVPSDRSETEDANHDRARASFNAVLTANQALSNQRKQRLIISMVMLVIFFVIAFFIQRAYMNSQAQSFLLPFEEEALLNQKEAKLSPIANDKNFDAVVDYSKEKNQKEDANAYKNNAQTPSQPVGHNDNFDDGLSSGGTLGEQTLSSYTQQETIKPSAAPIEKNERPTLKSIDEIKSSDASLVTPQKKVSSDEVKRSKIASSPKPVITLNSNSEMTEWIFQAYASFQNNDYERAKNIYLDILESDPHSRDALLGLAAIATYEQQYEQAINYYQRRLSLSPDDHYAVAGLFGLINNEKNTVTLLSDVNSRLDENPNAHYLHFIQGALLAKQKKWQKAQKSFFNAWQLQSNNANYIYNLAVSLDQLGEYKVALGFYRKLQMTNKTQQVQFERVDVDNRIKDLQRKVATDEG